MTPTSPPHPPVRWALIGASDIAATRVIPALRQVGHQAVVVLSSNPDRASSYAVRHGIGRGTDSLADALADEVDAVYVSTTNDLHAEQVAAAVAAGKHVLCEKPLALTLADAAAMVAAAEQAAAVLATNHHLRQSPVLRAIRELVSNGALGDLLAVRVGHAGLLPERLRGWRLQDVPGAGVVLDLVVHDADTVRFVTGREILEVTSAGVTQGAGSAALDAVVTAGVLAGGVSLQLHDAFTVPHAGQWFEVHGTEGSAVADRAMTQDPDGDVVLRRSGSDDEPVPVGPRRDLYEGTLLAFAAAVAGDGEPSASGRDGVASLAVALSVAESLATGRRVSVPR